MVAFLFIEEYSALVTIFRMVRFPCFSSIIYCPKGKKTVQPSVEAMQSSLQEFSEIQCMRDSPNSTHLKQLFFSAPGDTQVNGDEKHVSSSSFIERGWKSEEIKSKFSLELDMRFNELGHLKKSRSLGSRLCWVVRSPCENDTEVETDQGFSSDSHDQNGLVTQNGSNNPVVNPPDKYQKASQSESVQVGSDRVNMESVFSIGDLENPEKEGHENSDAPISGVEDYADEYVEHISRTPTIRNSQSSTNISGFMCSSGVCSSLKHIARNSRSAGDLQALDMRWKDIHDVDSQGRQKQERGDDIHKTVENHFDAPGEECFDSCNYSASAKDWIIPDEVNSIKNLHGESSAQMLDNLPSKDFKIKRIEEWVSDLQQCSPCSPVEEANDLSLSNNEVKKDLDVLNGLNFAKEDGKVAPGMEAAKRYIASLNGLATTAQLSNHGLVVIPFLSAFVSLKVLNLSGNAIVRITAGALPRGLHILNLSKNNISTIEGLRELTRLRVLDLSYNRICRIGHGLASCSSLKELYLAGNKISEAEGLHRLLKLTVLDLRFNKISTAKCLGQLAANYNSLQAISLEGNPAQKNVGDDHLKKYLQSLLPNIVYLNRQPMKASTLKDTADRSVRLGSIRSDNKATRKSSHGAGVHRPLSSTHGRKNQTVVSPPKRSRSRHAHRPPTGTKTTTSHRQNYPELGIKLLNPTSELFIRRSRSEGTLGGGL